MEKLSPNFNGAKKNQHVRLVKMSEDCDLWKDWTFSPLIQEEIDKFVTETIAENQNSDVSRRWLYLKNFSFRTESARTGSEENSSDDEVFSDVEGIVRSTVEVIESNSTLCESQFEIYSKKSLSRIFCEVQSSLSETGFLNFCKILGAWKEQNLVNICFDQVIFMKMKETEEAKLSVISALTELAKNKPEDFGKCVTKLLLNNSHKFTDAELLESVFTVLSNCERESIIMALIKEEHFKEINWHLLQVLVCKITESSFGKVISFMNSKCEQFASSQAFARLLVHICKNLQSSIHNDKLLNIIDKNKSLLKKQALKYLSSMES